MIGSGDILGYVLPAAAIIALVAGIRRLVRNIGLSCQFCDNTRCHCFTELSPEEQRGIVRYFRDCERREPDTTGVFVCRKCRTVYDDFSGEKDSMSPDSLVYKVGSRRQILVTCITFCKVCNTVMLHCDPENHDIRCPKCKTSYKWEVDRVTGYRFLMPPPGTKILERCHDHTTGTA